jgi:hypothetical protein
MKDLKRVEELVNELRELALDNVATKNDKVPDKEDLSKSKVDSIFDIDIFFSRKPGMRRSVQLITSNNKDKENLRVSCMTALASLCDTMVTNNLVELKDIILFMTLWGDMHNISIFDIRGNK